MAQKHTKQVLLKSGFKPLEEANAFFSNILDKQANGVILLDMEKRIQYFNPMAKKLLNKYNRLKIGEPFHLIAEMDARTKVSLSNSRGCEILLEFVPSLISAGKNSFYVINVYDLTELDATEKAYQETKERLNMAIEVSDLGLWEYDYPKDVTLVDSNYTSIFGYSVRDFPEGAFIRSVYFKDMPGVLYSWNQLLSGKSNFYDEIFRVVNRSGEIRWVHARSKGSKYDQNGKPYRFLGTIQDISKRKYSEIELSILYKMASISNENKHLKEKIREILNLMTDEFDVQNDWVVLFDDDNKEKFSVYKGHQSIKSIKWNNKGILSLRDSLKNDNKQIHPLHYRQMFDTEELEEPENHEVYFLNIAIDGKTIGLLILFFEKKRLLSDFERNILLSIANYIAIVVEKSILSEMATNSVKAEERQRLARELHDSVNQSLYSISLMLNGARDYALNDDQQNVLRIMNRLTETIQQTKKDMRLLIYELKPSVLGQEGLVKALQRRAEMLEKNSQIHTVLQIDCMPSFTEEVEGEIFGIVQEALNNVLKHSNATKVNIHLFSKDGNFIVTIKDNGLGFPASQLKEHKGEGFSNIYERSKRIGGKLQVLSQINKGTKIVLKLPLQE
jgi:PAS domain S-box-containing protein